MHFPFSSVQRPSTVQARDVVQGGTIGLPFPPVAAAAPFGVADELAPADGATVAAAPLPESPLHPVVQPSVANTSVANTSVAQASVAQASVAQACVAPSHRTPKVPREPAIVIIIAGYFNGRLLRRRMQPRHRGAPAAVGGGGVGVAFDQRVSSQDLLDP